MLLTRLSNIYRDTLKSVKRQWVLVKKKLPLRRKIVLKVEADKCNAHKGMPCTNVSCQCDPHLSKTPNSILLTEVLTFFEAGDTNSEIRTFAPETVKVLNQIFTAGYFIDDDGDRVDVLPAMIGDGLYANEALGCSGCSATYPCHLCEVLNRELCQVRKSDLRGNLPRTLDRIRLLAHVRCTRAGEVCPGCKKEIVATDAEVKAKPRKRVRVCLGLPTDPPIMSGWKSKWLKTHFGVRYGADVLWNVAVSNWVVCILQLNLRVTPYLIMHCIVKH